MALSSIYQALCFILSDRMDEVEWGAFSGQEWDAFGKRAQLERVAPLIHKKLKELGRPPDVPESVLTNLAQAYYKSSAFNRVLFVELERSPGVVSSRPAKGDRFERRGPGGHGVSGSQPAPDGRSGFIGP